jgi:hypothetical protein
MAHSNQWNGADAGLALLEQSLSLSEVACWMRAAAGSVYPWRQGAKTNGFSHELWTLQCSAAVMQIHVGARDHLVYIRCPSAGPSHATKRP